MKKGEGILPAPPTFRAPFTFASSPLSESLEQPKVAAVENFSCCGILFSTGRVWSVSF